MLHNISDENIWFQGPSIFCGICEKEGHLKSNCPEEQLPELKQLPTPTRQHLKLLTNVIKTVPGRYCLFPPNTILNGPRQANLVLITYASSKGSGEPAHLRSLARTFAARSYKQWVKRNLQTESQIPGPSEWLGMPSYNLPWRNARRHKFAWRGSKCVVQTPEPSCFSKDKEALFVARQANLCLRAFRHDKF